MLIPSTCWTKLYLGKASLFKTDTVIQTHNQLCLQVCGMTSEEVFKAELRSCVKREVYLGSHSLSHSSTVLNKPYGFCGRIPSWKKSLVIFVSLCYDHYFVRPWSSLLRNLLLMPYLALEYPPKWCTYSAGMAGATWNCCHLGAFCVHHTTMH